MKDTPFISPFLRPEPWQAEIIETLAEECSEAIQRAMKLCRFGIHEVEPGQKLTNVQRLSLELGDVLGMMEIAKAAGLLSDDCVNDGWARKLRRFEKYRQHRKPRQTHEVIA
ncbi:hypothetical protein [uncultured Hyphomicrobium sp.]|uniref:hypothetical protein n=1 Tax=uncultured Hyphomicrobium sp. TaxID=194373 RepID=UPI0025F6B260|nr:hypothetical protein [uncultured Hyphomicrobium sp.]